MNTNDPSPRARLAVRVSFLLLPHSWPPRMLSGVHPAGTGERSGQCHSRTLLSIPRSVPSSRFSRCSCVRVTAELQSPGSDVGGLAPPECPCWLPGCLAPSRSCHSCFLDGLGGSRSSGPWSLGAQGRGVTPSPGPMSSSHLLASSAVRWTEYGGTGRYRLES